MITVFILASRSDERSVKSLWMHLAMPRRTMRGVTFVEPLYVERLIDANALVATIQTPYVVIGCLSSEFVAMLLDQPALREFVEGASRRLPLVLSACQWKSRPCPFAGIAPLNWHVIEELSSSQRDSEFVLTVDRLRDTLTEMSKRGVA